MLKSIIDLIAKLIAKIKASPLVDLFKGAQSAMAFAIQVIMLKKVLSL